MGLLTKIFSSGDGKQLKAYYQLVDAINELEPSMQAMSDDQLKAQTGLFKQRLEAGESSDSLLPEAFATVREASVRTLGMRHFDVQLIGGMVLDSGGIAEMKTGEGKTLVSTLAGYLNALSGKGAHIVTVNDYLAKRDSEWMGSIYRFLGMDVGLIQAGMRSPAKVPAYQADVTYGTNSEFGFDYLRDNMVQKASSRVQRGHAFAIVDEVDSILIDEARTPLIISGIGTRAADTYRAFAKVMPTLRQDVDFELDEAKRTVMATEEGLAKVERALGIDDIYADLSGQLVNHLQQALKAQFLFHRDVDYMVVDGEVKIVDEFTGRVMEGRRYSEGLHQALEAKEGVLVKEENQTLATITLQNYFRLYEKLSGMTGTAMTEDAEFREIYKLGVVAIPPNRPVIREDMNDLVYRSIDAKFNAVVEDIIQRHKAGQPCLIGTVSIESSEKLSRLLDKRGIPHEVLNAKHHEREAHIIAQAGRVGAVTIATNMAGRGTDILLGGNPEFLADEILVEHGIASDEATEEQRAQALARARELCAAEHDQVVEVGGLAVIGTERHEARRIDNQLRGRSGRQGDPGVTRFYLSLEDDLMRLFAGDRVESIGRLMERANMGDDVPIEASMVSKAVESAQRKVEQMHFSSRKNVLEYDDVMNRQREAIYAERNEILDGKDIHARVEDIIRDTVERKVTECCPAKVPSDEWDWDGLNEWLQELSDDIDFQAQDLDHDENPQVLTELLTGEINDLFAAKEAVLGEEQIHELEALVMLRIMDAKWMNHLQNMDYLKTGIGLRAYGQRDPLTEYREEAHYAFGELRDSLYEDFIRTILRAKINVQEAQQANEQDERMDKATYSGPSEDVPSAAQAARSAGAGAGAGAASAQANVPDALKPSATGPAKTVVKDKDDPYANVGRNDLCPCGSGKKYKKCHGAAAGM